MENQAKGSHSYERFIRKFSIFERLRRRVFAAQEKVSKMRQGRRKVWHESRRLENLETDLLHRLRDLELSFEPVVQSFASAYILLVASAEAFINEIADVELKGRSEEEFDKLSVIGKWLFLPRLLGFRKKFKLDRDPLQGFAEVVRRRNKLIHHKAQALPLEDFDPAQVLKDLGLTPQHVERGVNCVRSLVREFSLTWKGAYGPDWLYPNKNTFRRPCFFIGDRKASLVLASNKIDGARL